MSALPRSDLAALLDPVPAADFFRDHWERKPLHVGRSRADQYAALLSVASVDRLLASPALPGGGVDVVRADAALDRAAFCRPDGSLDVVKASQLFAAGASIVVQEAHKWFDPVGALCRGLEPGFSAPVQANLYLSPAGAMAFETHYDTHDVFVLQVEGAKDWTVFDSPVPLPLAGQAFDAARHKVGPVTMSVTLRAGDCLYIPRGFLHHARARDEISLHLTLGPRVWRWADVLIETIADLCLSDPEFRRALPVDFAQPGFDAQAACQTFETLLQRAAATARPERVLERLADEFAIDRRPQVAGQLAQLAALPLLSADDEVGARPALVYRLVEEGDTVRLRCQGREVTLPVEASDAVRFALAHERYRVADLPGALDAADKVAIVGRLIEDGLVLRYGAPAASAR